MPRIVCLSDTHNCNERIEVPDGDILIHAGDATTVGTHEQIRRFSDWFASLPHPHKVFVAGNHDWLFEKDNDSARSLLDPAIVYLQDSAIEIDGLKIYGSPWQPRFFDWAFNLNRGQEMAEKWAMIPDDIDILITHGPPNGILDLVPRKGWDENLKDPNVYPPKFADTWFKGTGRTVENEIYFNNAQRPLIESPAGIFSMTDEAIAKNIEALAQVGIKATKDMFDSSLLAEV